VSEEIPLKFAFPGRARRHNRMPSTIFHRLLPPFPFFSESPREAFCSLPAVPVFFFFLEINERAAFALKVLAQNVSTIFCLI